MKKWVVALGCCFDGTDSQKMDRELWLRTLPAQMLFGPGRHLWRSPRRDQFEHHALNALFFARTQWPSRGFPLDLIAELYCLSPFVQHAIARWRQRDFWAAARAPCNSLLALGNNTSILRTASGPGRRFSPPRWGGEKLRLKQEKMRLDTYPRHGTRAFSSLTV